jgi:lipoate---protein ligase
MVIFNEGEFELELYNLGKVPWEESQLLYHALAKLGCESLCLLSPETPYVCIGYHQNVSQEVDLEFCRTKGIPVFRREVGGGAVFLDGKQLFFQVIIHRENPIAIKRIEAFYKNFLQPVIEVHHRIGIAAEYKPVNDLIVENRKISGTGAAEIGDCLVFVGNLILDFDYEMMSRVLKIPDEKFRDKVKKTIEENLTTIRRELGEQNYQKWDEQTLSPIMVEEFEKLLGPLKPAQKNSVLIEKIKELGAFMNNDTWLFRKGKRVSGRVIKVRSGLEVIYREYKAQGGLLRAEFLIADGRIADVSISGDFFCFPSDMVARLEQTIEGNDVNDLKSVLSRFYDNQNFELPGVGIADWGNLFKV